jgi:hypothetical protein
LCYIKVEYGETFYGGGGPYGVIDSSTTEEAASFVVSLAES